MLTSVRHFFRTTRRQRALGILEPLEQRTVFAAGELDASFGVGGIVRTEFNDSQTWGTIAYGTIVQNDGKVVAAGEGGMARFNTDGSLDNTFGTAGRVALPFYGRALSLQADGKVLVAGGTAQYNSSDMVIARYSSTGQLDATWDGDGLALVDLGGPNEWATSLLVEPTGRVVVAGGAGDSVAVARLTTTGQLDTAFSGDGKFTRQFTRIDTAYGLARQANGQILVVGTSWVDLSFNFINYDMFVLRLNANGSVDANFDGDGMSLINFTSSNYSRDNGHGIAVQADGKIVITGSVYGNFKQYTGVARLSTDGTLDNAFGIEGRVRLPVSSEVSTGEIFVLDDQQLLVADYRSFMRLSTTGELDTTFDGDGVVITDGFSFSAARSTNGQIIIGGRFDNFFGVKRFTASGVADSSFSGDGTAYALMGPSVDTAISSAIDADGRIVVVGSSQLGFAIARYLADGQLDNSFSEDGLQVIRHGDQYLDAQANSVVLQSDGKIVLAGWVRQPRTPGSYSSMALARLNEDGSLDATFSDDGLLVIEQGSIAEANSVVLQPDGKLVVGGVMDDLATLVRLNVDGSLDTSFSGDGLVSMASFGTLFSSVVLQPDGRILASGQMRPNSFSSTIYGSMVLVARFKANGALDPTFAVNGRMVDPTAQLRTGDDMVLLPDGSIVVVGDRASFKNGSESSYLALSGYSSNGQTLPAPYNLTYSERVSYGDFQSYLENSWGTSIYRQPDGKYLLVGYTYTSMIIRRVHEDGVIDSSFSGDGVLKVGLPNEQWRATNVVQGANGKIVVTGYSRTQSALGADNDFVVLQLQNQSVPDYSTKVYVNAQGNIEIADLWGRDDRFELSRVGENIVVRENGYDTHSSFHVVNLPEITGDGMRELTIPVSTISATGKPLIINAMAGDDTLLANNDTFDGPLTGLLFRGGTGADKVSLSNYQIPIAWILSAATSGAARPAGRIPINFTGVDYLEGGQNVDNFRLLFQGSSDLLKIDAGGQLSDAVDLRADGNITVNPRVFGTPGQRLVVDAGQQHQEYALLNFGRVNLRGGVGNNRIDAGEFLGTAYLYGGDGDDELYGPTTYRSELFGGSGRDLLFGGSQNDVLRGGADDDLLVGDLGDDQLYGEDGQDVLVGGYHLDTLYGGASDDLLLGGYSTALTRSRDAVTVAARDSILGIWRSSSDYATKIQQLIFQGSTGYDPAQFLPNSTVYNDGSLDTYFGNTGDDWFLVEVQTEVGLSTGGTRDRVASEELFDM